MSAVIYQITKAHRKNGDKPSVQDEFLSGFYKTDKLLPVITLTVYLDAKEWDAPRSLHEMLFMKDEELLKFIPDYKLNLITPADISDMDFSKFHTELSPVLKYLSPRSGKTVTMFPFAPLFMSFRTAAMAAPDDEPAKMPSVLAKI